MKKLLFTLVLLFSSVVGSAKTFKLGDINKDGKVTITDVMMVVDIVLNGYMPLELSSENVVVDYGSSATVNISSGYGPYDITCSDGNLVGVSLNGTLLSITGKAVGTAVVTLAIFLADNSPLRLSFSSTTKAFCADTPASALTISFVLGASNFRSSNTTRSPFCAFTDKAERSAALRIFFGISIL